MALIQPETLSGISNLLLPGAWGVAGRARSDGIPIKDITIQADFLHDEVQLCVRHALLTRRDLDVRDWKGEIGPRLQSAMRLFHRMPAAKALCVDRRRLVARGEKARKESNRPLRKATKKRAVQ